MYGKWPTGRNSHKRHSGVNSHSPINTRSAVTDPATERSSGLAWARTDIRNAHQLPARVYTNVTVYLIYTRAKILKKLFCNMWISSCLCYNSCGWKPQGVWAQRHRLGCHPLKELLPRQRLLGRRTPCTCPQRLPGVGSSRDFSHCLASQGLLTFSPASSVLHTFSSRGITLCLTPTRPSPCLLQEHWKNNWTLYGLYKL